MCKINYDDDDDDDDDDDATFKKDGFTGISCAYL